ncbi:putative oxidoreductase family, NAD-binding Rossmann fold [Lyophyllum shimeji]|uniref:Oxidoreductase family, NAD-binding Rossmann fold n=1 Tax=Lyophyllum shimeji TaxID=47721 RepID=A0A9P3PQR7_LYOSH|nr:putative oxidoreductase family, NAD-binding Rossmann fold [Lyophyllum shimeji]
MPSPIRVGFVGLSDAGWASTALAPSLLATFAYRLTAVSTTSAATASASAEKYSAQLGQPVKSFHGSTAHIAGDPEVDLVVVSVKAPSHKDAVLPALDAGKAVFVEWPAGSNLQETTEMAERARAKGARAAVGLQGRHSPVIRKVKELLDSGKIGKVLSTSLISMMPRDFGAWGPRVDERSRYIMDPSNGATMLDVALGHQLDICTHLLGDFASISATTSIIYPTATIIDASGTPVESDVPVKAPDHVAFTGVLRSGAVASVMCRGGYKSTSGRKPFVWEISGEEGVIRMEGDSAFANIVDPVLWVNDERVEVAGSEPYVGSLKAQWAEIAKGEEGRYATLEDAVRNRKLLQMIDRSAKEGRRINLE